MLVRKPSGKMVRKYYKQQYFLHRIIYVKLEPFKIEDKRWSSVINMANVHVQPPGVPLTFHETYQKLTIFTWLFYYKKHDMFGFLGIIYHSLGLENISLLLAAQKRHNQCVVKYLTFEGPAYSMSLPQPH
jgi:hypothetical protein